MHLVGELYAGDLEAAVQAALREVRGAYAIAVICEKEPDVLVVARKGSPLMVGVGKDEYIVASDSSAIVAHTTQAFTLEDYTVAKLTRDSFRTTTIDNIPITPQVRELEFDIEQIELGTYEHYMLKEISEQPQGLRLCLRGRIDTREGQIVLGGIAEYARELVKAKRIILLGQGTAYHADMVAEYLMEDLAKVPTEVEFASEFRYRNPIIEDGTVVIAFSQSGETADTLAALRAAKQRGGLTPGLGNVGGAACARRGGAAWGAGLAARAGAALPWRAGAALGAALTVRAGAALPLRAGAALREGGELDALTGAGRALRALPLLIPASTVARAVCDALRCSNASAATRRTCDPLRDMARQMRHHMRAEG